MFLGGDVGVLSRCDSCLMWVVVCGLCLAVCGHWLCVFVGVQVMAGANFDRV